MAFPLLQLLLRPQRRLIFALAWIPLAALFLAPAVAGQPNGSPPRISAFGNPVEKANDLREQTFEQVWGTIAEYYYDPKFNNVDWNKVYTEFRPRVMAAKDDTEFHGLLAEMIGRLKVSHLEIIPPEVFVAIEEAKDAAKAREALLEAEKTEDPADEIEDEIYDEDEEYDPFAKYGVGADLRYLHGRLLFTEIEAGSPAESSGIRTGHELLAINGVQMTEFITRIREAHGQGRIARMLPLIVVEAFFNGEEGSLVSLKVANGSGRIDEHLIERARNQGRSVNLGSGFPMGHLKFESRSLNSEIGYIRFTGFSLPALEKFCNALDDHRDKKGIVLDLRGNLGGLMAISEGIASMLTDSPLGLGTAIYRYGSEEMLARPKPKRYLGKLVIITDNFSFSAAEMFAAAMQESGRATVIGDVTAGETLPAMTVALATGGTLQYPIANYRTPKGVFLEGKGVQPAKAVALDRAKLLNGVDSQLEAAVKEMAALLASNDEGGPSKAAEYQGPVTIMGTGNTAKAPPPPPPPMGKTPSPQPPGVIEPAAVKLMEDFARLTGGPPAYESVQSYELTGTVELLTMGSSNAFSYRQARSGDKWAEGFYNDSVGEIKEIRDGKVMHMRSDLGQEYKTPFALPVRESEFISAIVQAMKPGEFRKLLYLGEFERVGEKVHLIDAETNEGVTVAIYFNSDTKMLAGFEGPTGGLSFGDFRPTSGPPMPFRITSSLGSVDIVLDEVLINSAVDPSFFVHRERCFDRAEPVGK